MALVDVNKIIHGTPTKRIQVAYNEMKESYTKESADKYYDVYSKEPLSAVLENSRIIFSEPFRGLDYYKSIVLDPSSCIFTSLESELDKVEEYVESNKDKLPTDQYKLYSELLTEMGTFVETTKSSQICATYISENIDSEFEDKISDIIHNLKMEGTELTVDFPKLFEEANDLCFITYFPYVVEAASEAGVNINSDMAPLCLTIGTDKTNSLYIEEVLFSNKLVTDGVYHKALSTDVSRANRAGILSLASESVHNILQDMIKDHVQPKDIVHVTAESAVNNIFDTIDSYSVPHFEDAEEKEKVSKSVSEAVGHALDLLQYDLSVTESNTTAMGYSVLMNTGNSYTIEDTITTLTSNYAEFLESDEDVTDDDIEQMNNDVNGDGKKPEAPDAGSRQQQKMVKAMDKEAKFKEKQALREQKGQERKAALQAKTAIPRSVMQKIQRDVNHLDEMDDERRKAYLVKPGFRKKWFRNLKLAILYGGALSYKFTMFPIVLMCRHFSKQKDRRMRNELVRELDTEISIAEEKINDASANGDIKQKYRLMRIRDQLKAERTRVAVNSKYI